jgi:integrase
MARSIRSNTLEARSNRLKLPVAREPEWVRIGDGLSLGYRRNRTAGTWVVRRADGKGGYERKAIGTADDYEDANGRDVLDYWQACDKARHLARGDSGEPAAPILTVADALSRYADDLATRGGDKANVSRLRFNLPSGLLKRPVALLDVTELRKWRDAAAKRMAAPSVNRLATILKAVLNLAASKDERLSTRPWEIALAALPEATSANNVVLPEATIRQLVQAAREQSPEFGLLVETLALTGARVSQLARALVRDLMGERLMIPSSAKGQNKRASRTPVPIPATLANAMRVAAAERPQSAPLLVKPSGEAWAKSDHARPFKRAVEAIGEDPERVSSYALRHSHITAQLLKGLPVQLVAKLHDTSASQIERHYAATIASHTDELVRGAMIEFDRPDGVVVPLHGART